VTNGTKII